MMKISVTKKNEVKPQVGDFVYAEWNHAGDGFYQIQKINGRIGLRHIDGRTYAFFSDNFDTVPQLIERMNDRLRKWELYSQDEYEMNLVPKAVTK
ncbi:hypothetical protein LWL40_27775 (plasmid) [Bacillus thuringiensis]|uniref:hypothetical protein n=1 Tax=Bacillus thuringiensis TaxID=1428 RepID=UPI003D751644